MFFGFSDPGAGGCCDEAAPIPPDWTPTLVFDIDFSQQHLWTSGTAGPLTRTFTRDPYRYEFIAAGGTSYKVDVWTSGSTSGSVQDCISSYGAGAQTTATAITYLIQTSSAGAAGGRSIGYEMTANNSAAGDLSGISNVPGTVVFVVMHPMWSADGEWGSHFCLSDSNGGSTNERIAICTADNSGLRSAVEWLSSGGGISISNAGTRDTNVLMEHRFKNTGTQRQGVLRHRPSATTEAWDTSFSIPPMGNDTGTEAFIGARYWRAGSKRAFDVKGKIRRVIGFRSTGTPGDRKRLIAWLMHKYNIT